jgi:molybdate transport system permease protein
VLVTLPLIAPGIVAGMVLSFARSLGEFGATITFVSNIPSETRTIASAIYTLTQTPGGDIGALRLTLVSIALSFVALFAADLEALGLAVGREVFAVIKTVAIDRRSLSRQGETAELDDEMETFDS